MERNDFGNSSFQPGVQGGMSQVIARAEEARLEAVKSKEIIESLIADYENIMIVNLDTDEMSIYKFDDRYSEYFGILQKETEAGWKNYIQFISDRVIDVRYKALFEDTVDTENVKRELKDKPAISFEYAVITPDGKRHYYRSKISKYGCWASEHKILLSAICTDDRQAEFRNQMEIFGSLVSDFDYIFSVDITQNSVVDVVYSELLSECVPDWKTTDNFLARINMIADNLVVDEDRDSFIEKISPGSIVEELSTKDSFYINFRVKPSEMIHYYQAKVVPYGNDRSRYLFGIYCVDDEMAKEAEIMRNLEQTIEERTQELTEINSRLNLINDEIIAFMGNIVEARDVESGEHIRRVKGFTHILATEVMKQCPEYELSPERVNLITSASALHDIGKIMIPDAILLKPGKLTAEEFEIMKTHSLKGCDILAMAPRGWSDEYLITSTNICKYHHEKYDGKGYPEGLVGDQIPIEAQIVSIVDCYDALINRRCYKDAYPLQESFDMIVRGECGVFSDKILKCFAACEEEFEYHAKNPESSFDQKVPVSADVCSISGMRLMVVDDNELTLEITKEILEESGVSVVTATNGLEAVKLYSDPLIGSFDAIIMDILMPVMDGPEAAMYIRKSGKPDAETIPIIAFTASRVDEDVDRAIEYGMDYFVYKPISISSISKVLFSCMKDKAEGKR